MMLSIRHVKHVCLAAPCRCQWPIQAHRRALPAPSQGCGLRCPVAARPAPRTSAGSTNASKQCRAVTQDAKHAFIRQPSQPQRSQCGKVAIAIYLYADPGAEHAWERSPARTPPDSLCCSVSPMQAMTSMPCASALAAFSPTNSLLSSSRARRSEWPRMTQCTPRSLRCSGAICAHC